VSVGVGVADGVSVAIEVGDRVAPGSDVGNGVWVGIGVDGGLSVMVGAAVAGGVPVGFGVGDNTSALAEVADGVPPGVEIDGSTALDAGVSVGVPVVIGVTVSARTGCAAGVGGTPNLFKMKKNRTENKRRSAIHTATRFARSPSASVPLIFGFIDNSPRIRLSDPPPGGVGECGNSQAGGRLDQACHPGLDHHEGQAVVEGGPHRLGLPAPARPGCPDPAPSRIPGTGSGRDRDAVRAGVVRHRWASSRAAKVEREGGRLLVIGSGPCVNRKNSPGRSES
jgi:hypothetical protein